MTDLANPSVAWDESSPLAGDTPRREDSRIVIAVMVIGALIAAQALLGLLGSIGTSFGAAKSGSAFAGALCIAYVILGVGLVLRKELARQAYVVLAVISLILLAVACVGLTVSSRGQATTPAAQSAYAYMAAHTRAEITEIQHSRFLSPAAKQQQIRDVTRVEEGLKAQEGVSNGSYGALLPGFLLAFIGLVFFTRPSVKQVFE